MGAADANDHALGDDELGGYALSEVLFYMGERQTFEAGEHVVHGQQCAVVGPATKERKGEGLAMWFEGTLIVECDFDELSRDPPPPLPGKYKLGDMLYNTAESETFPSGNRVVHGAQGQVVGPAMTHEGKGLQLMFEGNTSPITFHIDKLSRDPPPPLPAALPYGRSYLSEYLSEYLS